VGQLEAIKWVTGGVTLAAFIVAVVAAVVRAALHRHRDLLGTIAGSPKEVEARERVVSALLERFHIDTTGMSSSDKMKLALRQLEERRRRLGLLVWLGIVVVIVAAAVTVVAITRTGDARRSAAPSETSSTRGPEPRTVEPGPDHREHAAPGDVQADHGIAAGHDVEIKGSTVNIGDAPKPASAQGRQ